MRQLISFISLFCSLMFVGCAGHSRERGGVVEHGALGDPVVESLCVKASSTLSPDQRLASILFEGVSARVDVTGVNERFVTLQLPIQPQSVGVVPVHLGIRGGGVVTSGHIELWQMSPQRRLLWSSRNHNGNYFAQTMVTVEVEATDLVVGSPVVAKIARASFYLKAVGTGPDGALIELDSIDAAIDGTQLTQAN